MTSNIFPAPGPSGTTNTQFLSPMSAFDSGPVSGITFKNLLLYSERLFTSAYSTNNLTVTPTAAISLASGGASGTYTFVVATSTGIVSNQIVTGTGLSDDTFVVGVTGTSPTFTVRLSKAFSSTGSGTYNFYDPTGYNAITSSSATQSFSQTVPVASNTVYTFSFYTKTGTATDVSYGIVNANQGSNIVNNTSYYNQINIIFNTTATGTSGQNSITVGNATGLYIGLSITAATGIILGTRITNISGTTITLNANNSSTVSDSITFTDTRWQRIILTFTTPADCTSVRLYPIWNIGSGFGTNYITALQLELGNTATAYQTTNSISPARLGYIAPISNRQISITQLQKRFEVVKSLKQDATAYRIAKLKRSEAVRGFAQAARVFDVTQIQKRFEVVKSLKQDATAYRIAKLKRSTVLKSFKQDAIVFDTNLINKLKLPKNTNQIFTLSINIPQLQKRFEVVKSLKQDATAYRIAKLKRSEAVKGFAQASRVFDVTQIQKRFTVLKNPTPRDAIVYDPNILSPFNSTYFLYNNNINIGIADTSTSTIYPVTSGYSFTSVLATLPYSVISTPLKVNDYIKIVDSVTNISTITSLFAVNNSGSVLINPVNQATYTTTGSYTWAAPLGVTSVSVVVVGGGGGGGSGNGSGGGGGALTYVNNLSVVPGINYKLQVGVGGAVDTDGTASWFGPSNTIADAYVYANGGSKGTLANDSNAAGQAVFTYNSGILANSVGASGSGTYTTVTLYHPGISSNISLSGYIYNWTVPAGVTSISVLAVGGGGVGYASGGGGGGLGWKNNITVTPGQTYQIGVAPQGGIYTNNGGDSWLQQNIAGTDTLIVGGFGGNFGPVRPYSGPSRGVSPPGYGGSYYGDGGGAGGAGGISIGGYNQYPGPYSGTSGAGQAGGGGGGGAGGYSGAGGGGGTGQDTFFNDFPPDPSAGSSSTGGGGGGGAGGGGGGNGGYQGVSTSYQYGMPGGGVNIYGIVTGGFNGVGGAKLVYSGTASHPPSGGYGGSYTENLVANTTIQSTWNFKLANTYSNYIGVPVGYGAGGGGSGAQDATGGIGTTASGGIVRIIWGYGASYPSAATSTTQVTNNPSLVGNGGGGGAAGYGANGGDGGSAASGSTYAGGAGGTGGGAASNVISYTGGQGGASYLTYSAYNAASSLGGGAGAGGAGGVGAYGGGGVSYFGQTSVNSTGATTTAGAATSSGATASSANNGGSGGTNGTASNGGTYGAGGAGNGIGGNGFVRIIWFGATRSYPLTRTTDQPIVIYNSGISSIVVPVADVAQLSPIATNWTFQRWTPDIQTSTQVQNAFPAIPISLARFKYAISLIASGKGSIKSFGLGQNFASNPNPRDAIAFDPNNISKLKIPKRISQVFTLSTGVTQLQKRFEVVKSFKQDATVFDVNNLKRSAVFKSFKQDGIVYDPSSLTPFSTSLRYTSNPNVVAAGIPYIRNNTLYTTLTPPTVSGSIATISVPTYPNYAVNDTLLVTDNISPYQALTTVVGLINTGTFSVTSGQALFTSSGYTGLGAAGGTYNPSTNTYSYIWTCPPNVYSVAVVCIGGGGGGANSGATSPSTALSSSTGGGGGALAYKNNITVIPNTQYAVVVGAGGSGVKTISTNEYGSPGGESYFKDKLTVYATGGAGGNYQTLSTVTTTVSLGQAALFGDGTSSGSGLTSITLNADSTGYTAQWTCPPNIYSVSVVCVGGGGGGGGASGFNYQGLNYSAAAGGGGGGGLSWSSTIAVVPGRSYTIQAGRGGVSGTCVSGNSGGTAGGTGGTSYFNDTSTLYANGGTGGGVADGRGILTNDQVGSAGGAGGGYGGTSSSGGGTGGAASGGAGTNAGTGSAKANPGAGGGAGGYTGAGGQARSLQTRYVGVPQSRDGGTAGAGGGGGGGGGDINSGGFTQGISGGAYSGGGVGILGQGPNGDVGGFGAAQSSGGGGSYGTTVTSAWAAGGVYGGGAPGGIGGSAIRGNGTVPGGIGAIRIIWPATKQDGTVVRNYGAGYGAGLIADDSSTITDYFLGRPTFAITVPIGQALFDGAGYRSDGGTAGVQNYAQGSGGYYTYQWTCPANVYNVSVICIGGGGGGNWASIGAISNPGVFQNGGGDAGGGGGLSWGNNIPVVPGRTYTVIAGAGGIGGSYSYGSGLGDPGGTSSFGYTGTTYIYASGGGASNGVSGTQSTSAALSIYTVYNGFSAPGGGYGGTYAQGGGVGGGGDGGHTYAFTPVNITYYPFTGGAGGGAGGYAGTGSGMNTSGIYTTATVGSGAGGRGYDYMVYNGTTQSGGGGGGVGIYGIGTKGNDGSQLVNSQGGGTGGGGGSSGNTGGNAIGSTNPGANGTGLTGGDGASYGGGGGGGTRAFNSPGAGADYSGGGGNGGAGAVRIIWPATKSVDGSVVRLVATTTGATIAVTDQSGTVNDTFTQLNITGATGGSFVAGDGGGRGGDSGSVKNAINSTDTSYASGGGGAGGYGGAGGTGGDALGNGGTGNAASNGASGAGAGGGATAYGTVTATAGAGGGVGVIGIGSNGTAGSVATVSNVPTGGSGGSNGASGSNGSTSFSIISAVGGAYGGGGGGTVNSDSGSIGSGAGAGGAVRIIWPATKIFDGSTLRAFPGTSVIDQNTVINDSSPNYIVQLDATTLSNFSLTSNWSYQAYDLSVFPRTNVAPVGNPTNARERLFFATATRSKYANKSFGLGQNFAANPNPKEAITYDVTSLGTSRGGGVTSTVTSKSGGKKYEDVDYRVKPAVQFWS